RGRVVQHVDDLERGVRVAARLEGDNARRHRAVAVCRLPDLVHRGAISGRDARVAVERARLVVEVFEGDGDVRRTGCGPDPAGVAVQVTHRARIACGRVRG